jgi:hypothetical protein
MALVKDYEMTRNASDKRFHVEEFTDERRDAFRGPVICNAQHEYPPRCFWG